MEHGARLARPMKMTTRSIDRMRAKAVQAGAVRQRGWSAGLWLPLCLVWLLFEMTLMRR